MLLSIKKARSLGREWMEKVEIIADVSEQGEYVWLEVISFKEV